MKRSQCVSVPWMKRMVWVGLLALAPTLPTPGADPDPSLLSIERIFDSDEFSGASFDGHWDPAVVGYVALDSSEQGVVRYDPESAAREVLVPGAHLIPSGRDRPLTVERFWFSTNAARLLIFTNSKRVWRQNTRGDYWVLDVTSRELRQLGGDAAPSTLMFATFSPDGRRACYVRENNLYVEDLVNGGIRALTLDGSDTVINGTFDWVYEEEFSLRRGFRWSPDSRRIAFWRLDTSLVPEFVMINNTEGMYPSLTRFRYPKTGHVNAACHLVIAEIGEEKLTPIEVPGDPRNHYLAWMDWAGNSREILMQQLNRLQNTNLVMTVDTETGQIRPVLTETDSAWVDLVDELRWVGEEGDFIWLSERSGWRHLYRGSKSGGKLVQLTKGELDVISIEGMDHDQIYFVASPDNPSQRFLYRVPIKGGKTKRVTPAPLSGTHSYQISPDGHYAIHSHSAFGRPPVTDLVELPQHTQLRVLEGNTNLIAKVEALRQHPVEFGQLDIGDGVELDSWCMSPPDLDPTQTYPVLVYVYGEPAGQTVLDRWGGSGYLWHLFLAQKGYVVMSIDNRGTASPRGRAWRKSIYRQVGILASADQAAAVRKVLSDRPYLDPKRVGVWGWSGGGSMTLNAMFRYPELYSAGIAVAPVPNQRLYDTIYQERYMGLPDDNVDGYRDGSPITYAQGLTGPLLLVHGTGDDNCHYQGMEQLVNELIAHKKQFSMMAYPNRSHSIREGQNTRLHLYQLLTRFLEENL